MKQALLGSGIAFWMWGSCGQRSPKFWPSISLAGCEISSDLDEFSQELVGLGSHEICPNLIGDHTQERSGLFLWVANVRLLWIVEAWKSTQGAFLCVQIAWGWPGVNRVPPKKEWPSAHYCSTRVKAREFPALQSFWEISPLFFRGLAIDFVRLVSPKTSGDFGGVPSSDRCSPKICPEILWDLV